MKITATTLPLTQLIKSPLNVRTKERDEAEERAIDGLAESIATVGLLQPIVVHKVTKPKGKYGVIAGGRRLAALCRLQDDRGDGGCQDIKHLVPLDFTAIPVQLVEDASDAELASASLTENYARLAMSDVEIYRAIEKVRAAKQGEKLTDEWLASTFGVDVPRMRRILRLAHIHPQLLELYERRQLSLDSLKAYASVEDQAAQLAAYEALEGWQADHARYIRQQLGTAPDADYTEALRFVGAEAYEAAGGTITHDLFDPGASKIEDKDLLARLLNEKLEAIRQQIIASRPGIDITFTDQPIKDSQGYTEWSLRASPERDTSAIDEDESLSEEEYDAAYEALPEVLPDAATVCQLSIERGALAVQWWFPDRKAAGLTERASSSSAATPAAPKVKPGDAGFDDDNPPLTGRATDHLKAMRVNQAARHVLGEEGRQRHTAKRAHRALIFALGRQIAMGGHYSSAEGIGLGHSFTGSYYGYMGTSLAPVQAPKYRGLRNPDALAGWLEFDEFMDDEQIDQLAGWIFARKIEPTFTAKRPTVVTDVFQDLGDKADARAAAQPDMDTAFFKLFPKAVIGAFMGTIHDSHRQSVMARKGDEPANYAAEIHGKAEPGSPASAWLFAPLRWLGFMEPEPARAAGSGAQGDELEGGDEEE